MTAAQIRLLEIDRPQVFDETKGSIFDLGHQKRSSIEITTQYFDETRIAWSLESCFEVPDRNVLFAVVAGAQHLKETQQQRLTKRTRATWVPLGR